MSRLYDQNRGKPSVPSEGGGRAAFSPGRRDGAPVVIVGAEAARTAWPAAVAASAAIVVHDADGRVRGARAVGERRSPMVSARQVEERMVVRQVVMSWLSRAGRTLRRLPRPDEARLSGLASNWPQILHSRDEHNAWETPRVSPARPSRREIDELDAVLDWLIGLDAEVRPVVLAKMLGFGFRRIARLDPHRRSFKTLARVYDRAVTDLVAHALTV